MSLWLLSQLLFEISLYVEHVSFVILTKNENKHVKLKNGLIGLMNGEDPLKVLLTKYLMSLIFRNALQHVTFRLHGILHLRDAFTLENFFSH